MVYFNLVIRVRSAYVLVAFTFISRFSRPLSVFMVNFISIRPMVVGTILVNIRLTMTVMVSSISRPLMVAVAMSMNSLRTSVVVAYTRVSIARLSFTLVKAI